MLSRKLHMILTAVVLLAACAWLPYGFLQKDMNVWLRITMALVGILSFVVLFERDMYLPFLADCAFPTSLLKPLAPATGGEGEVAVSISKLPAGAKVVYWAAESKDPRAISAKNWKEAYGEYGNAGVVVANAAGIANISIRCPQPYTVAHLSLHTTELPPHIHYRYELPGTKGMLSEVYTLAVKCDKNTIGVPAQQ